MADQIRFTPDSENDGIRFVPDQVSAPASTEAGTLAAYKRLQTNDSLKNLLNIPEGSFLPDYTPEQEAQDRKIVALTALSEQGKKLQKEASKMEDISKSGKLRSAEAGLVISAYAIPELVKAISENVANKSGVDLNRIFPANQIMDKALEEQQARAGINPTSGFVGYLPLALAQQGIGGIGGVANELSRGAFTEAAKLTLPSAIKNTVLGSGLRVAAGGEVTPGTAALDFFTGGLTGGKNPELNEKLKNLPSNIRTLAGEVAPNLSESLSKAVETAKQSSKNLAEASLNKLETITARGVKGKPIEDVLTNLTNITQQEGSLELAPTVKSRILEATGGEIPKLVKEGAASEGVKTIKKTQDYVLDKTISTLEQAKEQGLSMRKDFMRGNMEEKLKQSFSRITQPEMDAVIDPILKKFPEDKIDPIQGQKDLKEFNRSLDSFHEGSEVARRRMLDRPDVVAELGAAESLSNQLGDIYQATSGLVENPYRDWGSLQKFKEGLQDSIVSAQQSQSSKNSGRQVSSPSAKALAASATSPKLAAAQGVKLASDASGASGTIKRIFTKRPIEELNQDWVRFLKEAPSNDPTGELSPADRNALRDKYLSENIPQSQSSNPEYENKVNAIIKKLPQEIRSDPYQARIMAEKILSKIP